MAGAKGGSPAASGGQEGGDATEQALERLRGIAEAGSMQRKAGAAIGEGNPFGKGLSAVGNSFNENGDFDMAALLDPRIRQQNEEKRMFVEQILKELGK